MPPLRDDRGAVTVWVAILMVPLLVATALAIDIAAAYADRQRLQTGADAAALAIAECRSTSSCSMEQADEIAQDLAAENEPVVGDHVDVEVQWPGDERVVVTTSTRTEHWFAPVIGIDETTVPATAAASWSGELPEHRMPVAFSFCTIQALTGATATVNEDGMPSLDITDPTGEVTLYTKGGEHDAAAAACQRTNGWSTTSGNFGWLDVESTCLGGLDWLRTGVAVGSPGNAPVDACKRSIMEFTRIIEAREPLLVPIFSDVAEGGSSAQYTIVGYAIIRLNGIAYTVLGSASTSCGKTCFDVEILDWVEADSDARPIAEPVVRLTLLEGSEP